MPRAPRVHNPFREAELLRRRIASLKRTGHVDGLAYIRGTESRAYPAGDTLVAFDQATTTDPEMFRLSEEGKLTTRRAGLYWFEAWSTFDSLSGTRQMNLYGEGEGGTPGPGGYAPPGADGSSRGMVYVPFTSPSPVSALIGATGSRPDYDDIEDGDKYQTHLQAMYTIGPQYPVDQENQAESRWTIQFTTTGGTGSIMLLMMYMGDWTTTSKEPSVDGPEIG